MEAVCVITNSTLGVTGYIEFTEDKVTEIKVKLQGLPEGYHALHIHEYGDLREGCSSLCSHFNPFDSIHGDISDNRNYRHVGDLGNIYADIDGNVDTIIHDKLVKLSGKNSIIGRSVVIHEDADDLGRGGLDHNGIVVDQKRHEESLRTGNAGSRIACGVIGLARTKC
jgi:Cu-Zn family superoxide dismutase